MSSIPIIFHNSATLTFALHVLAKRKLIVLTERNVCQVFLSFPPNRSIKAEAALTRAAK